MAKKHTQEEILSKFKEKHGDEYDYSKVNYVNFNTKVEIICKKHGVFEQTPHAHLTGRGCPVCGKEKVGLNEMIKVDDFMKRCKESHSMQYNYDKTVYNGMTKKIIVTCPIHGDFEQNAWYHANGGDCPKCAHAALWENRKPVYANSFEERARKVHGGKYDYSKVVYKSARTPILIICPEHGEFYQTPEKHLSGCGCQRCGKQFSYSENEFVNFIKSNLSESTNIIQHDRTICEGKELDLYIPDMNVAFEYNGMVWHSEKFGKDRWYHLNKLNKCKEQGIKLYHIWSYEWKYKNDIIRNKILHLLHKDKLNKIYARKCSIKEIDKVTSDLFLDKYHLQGFVNSTVRLGIFYNDELVGVMTFKKERKDSNDWELTRFCTKNDYEVIGAGGKLFDYFLKEYHPNLVKSFADRRWTLDEDNNLYTKLGFKLDKIIHPDYKYTRSDDEYFHKFGFRKNTLLRKYPDSNLDISMTENEMTSKLGYYKVWDCGLFKFIYENIS